MATLASTEVFGSLTVSGTIHGDLSGTASYATRAIYALNAGNADTATSAAYADNSGNASTADYATSAGSADTAATATTADYATSAGSADTAATATTADYATSAGNADTAGNASTADYATSAGSADNATNAISASYAPSSHVEKQIISGSSFTGDPKIYVATYSQPFNSSIYVCSVVGQDARVWSVIPSTTGSVICSNSNQTIDGFVYCRFEEI
jgi:hypothetical protein